MEERQREHIGRIVTLAFASSRAALRFELESVLTEFSRAGRTGGGMAIVAAGKKCSRATDVLIGELAHKIAAVSRSPDAFTQFESATRRWLRICRDDLMNFADRSRGTRLQDRGTADAALVDEALAKVEDAVSLRLSVEEMDFGPSVQSAVVSIVPKEKKGGRPPADFWDSMWASIAASLYCGDLEPKSQADIERAMAVWIEDNGASAAESTIRARARRLWDKLTAVE